MRKETKPFHVLLRSSWQTVNIGDISHTPGMLAAIERTLPDAQVTLWPCDLSRGVEGMLKKRFPHLMIVRGGRDDLDDPASELSRAFAASDLMLHGSGPSIITPEDLTAWSQRTLKPYGMLGVTLNQIPEAIVPVLDDAMFVFCRDTISVTRAQQASLQTPVVEFGPDAAFACDLANDRGADTLLKDVGLDCQPFVVVIPRMRYTPYHTIHDYSPGDQDRQRIQVSERHLDSDMQLLADYIEKITLENNLDVIIAPEMTYQIEMSSRHLIPRLSKNCRRRVRTVDEYWPLDVACSVYERASLVVSMEMHSPILSVARGTPAILIRQPTDTCKGQMWRDVGLAQWMFEIDETQADALVLTTRQILSEPNDTMRRVASANRYTGRCLDQCLKQVAACAMGSAVTDKGTSIHKG